MQLHNVCHVYVIWPKIYLSMHINCFRLQFVSFLEMNYLISLLLTKLEWLFNWSCTWGKVIGVKFIVPCNMTVIILTPWIKISRYKITLSSLFSRQRWCLFCVLFFSGTVQYVLSMGSSQMYLLWGQWCSMSLHLQLRNKQTKTPNNYWNNYKDTRWV